MMPRLPTRTLLSVALLALVGPVVADVLTPQIYILEADEEEDEDAYIATSSARIDGTVRGDVVIAAGAIDIGGVVEGDLFVVSHSRLRITGTVAGSVRGLAREVVIDGTVAGDVAMVAGSLNVAGQVGRDVLLLAGSSSVTGAVERDVKGRALDGLVDGSIGRDVDVTVRTLRVGPLADIGGDLVYRSDGDAAISGGAKVVGRADRLPSRATFIVRVWLIGATILSFLAFVGSGFVLFVVFRSSMARATGLVRTETWRTIWVGLLAVLGLPLLSIVFVFTVVGAPIGILLIVLWLLGLVFAPVPAVAAGGDVVLRGRGGILGAFMVGAVLWRLGIWIIPLVGVLLYTAALAAGTGGLVLAAWRQRRAGAAVAERLLPPGPQPESDVVPDDWQPPLAPAATSPDPLHDEDDGAG